MESQNPEPDLSPSTWALAWERQILLEILRDSEPLAEIPALLERLEHREIRNIRPAFPFPKQIARMAAARCTANAASVAQSADLADLADLEAQVAQAIARELEQSIAILMADGWAPLCERLELLIQPEILFRSPEGAFLESNIDTDVWGMWYPGLDNDRRSMQQLLDSLPGADEGAIPMAVQWFEDPSSPLALPGAVSLAWHDAIHILLGRGLLDQDEAFVVGFAMGNASTFRGEDAVTLRNALAHDYPEPFRVHGPKLAVFDLGIEAGRSIGIPDLALQEGRLTNDAPLGAWRDRCGIDTEKLRAFYVRESFLLPRTLESARLPLEAPLDRHS